MGSLFWTPFLIWFLTKSLTTLVYFYRVKNTTFWAIFGPFLAHFWPLFWSFLALKSAKNDSLFEQVGAEFEHFWVKKEVSKKGHFWALLGTPKYHFLLVTYLKCLLLTPRFHQKWFLGGPKKAKKGLFWPFLALFWVIFRGPKRGPFWDPLFDTSNP